MFLSFGTKAQTAFFRQDPLFPCTNENIMLTRATDVLHAPEEDLVSIQKKRPWLAAAEVFSTNIFVWGFNYFIMDADFAYIDIHSFKRNLSYWPVWDTDKFSTNLLAHPYHGNLYFNAARSNGLNFWQSAPYAFGGSLMWEYFMENELPSMNDLYATTLGGICLGEITFRLSDLLIDNTSTGWERFFREFGVACISPVRGINRLLNKQSWKREATKGRAISHAPILFSPTLGARFLSEYGRSRDGEFSAALGLNLIYGERFSQSYYDYYKPFEWFSLKCEFEFFSHQPIVTQVNATGVLWAKNINHNDKYTLTFGAFQHFDFYNSQIENGNGDLVSPYRISEAAAYGLGMLFSRDYDVLKEGLQLRATAYVNGIILGGTITDHFRDNERDYNMGSGYSVKTYAGITLNKRWSIDLSGEHYHIYTWKSTSQKGFNSTQGDEGHSHLTVLSPYITYHSGKKWKISVVNRHFLRVTRYKHYPDVDYSTTDFLITFGCVL